MRKSFAFFLILLLAAGSAMAVSPGPSLQKEGPRPGELRDDLTAPSFLDTRQDTAWFGGDNGSGRPYLDGVYDFESPGSNGFQGCRSWDETVNPAVYFGRVNAANFTSHGDPCVPMINGTAGQLWCGVHQDEADLRDFLAGMGYGNDMCQRALSPMYPINPATQSIDIAFSYFQHSEPDFDYTFILVLCYDTYGDVVEEYEIQRLDAVHGDHTAPALFDEGVEVQAGALPASTINVQLEFRFNADGGYSDEDGSWDTPCGPFAADDVQLTIGSTPHTFNFNDGAQGWTFQKCEGAGAYLHVVHDYEYQEWLDDLGLTCACTLSGDAIAFVSTTCMNGPGLVPGQKEQFETGTLPRVGYPAPYWNAVVVEYDAFLNMPNDTGAHYRPGWRKYPYTTETNPVPHWSKRQGQDVWYFLSSPFCGLNRDNLSAMADSPLPVDWDSVRYTFEVYCSCDGFATPPSVCVEEGCTGGSPALDNIKIGITNSANAPPLSFADGAQFMDGFGQNYPTYLEPSDRCNSNVSFDLSRDDTAKNDWHGDSSVVSGPVVGSAASRWLCEMCFQVSRLGARQAMIPEYHTWKARLDGDPEEDYVCVLMDSLETNNGANIWKNKFASYFHENDPAYRAPGDFNERNEIFPDQIFVPGTRVEYYMRSYWFNNGAPPTDYFVLGGNPPREMEFLPAMEVRPGEDYTVQWPSVLYVDGFNRGSETFMLPALAQLGIDFDKFDYLDASSNYNAPIKRSLGGTTFNPGGYGNNGCTTEQLLGYRLVILNDGSFGQGSMERADFELLDQWLASTSCGLTSVRRGLVLDGDQICQVMADEVLGLGLNFAHNILGVTYVAESYRDHNEDPAFCVYLEPVTGAQFSPAAPGVGLYGNGCPQEFNYNVLGIQPGVANVSGNLDFWSYEQTGNQQYVDYAQVVRRYQQSGVANWRSVVNGFSFHHLSERSCAGEPCGQDTLCRVAGTSDVYGPMIEWLANGGTPFHQWTYPCINTAVDPDENHYSGPVNYLHQSRPNPFNSRATIRFSLASAGEVNLSVYDVAGRMVKTLLHGDAPAGENSVVWDGTDNQGNRVGGGVFWMQMTTHDGFSSGKKMLVLR
jgi:hypothetical protein